MDPPPAPRRPAARPQAEERLPQRARGVGGVRRRQDARAHGRAGRARGGQGRDVRRRDPADRKHRKIACRRKLHLSARSPSLDRIGEGGYDTDDENDDDDLDVIVEGEVIVRQDKIERSAHEQQQQPEDRQVVEQQQQPQLQQEQPEDEEALVQHALELQREEEEMQKAWMEKRADEIETRAEEIGKRAEEIEKRAEELKKQVEEMQKKADNETWVEQAPRMGQEDDDDEDYFSAEEGEENEVGELRFPKARAPKARSHGGLDPAWDAAVRAAGMDLPPLDHLCPFCAEPQHRGECRAELVSRALERAGFPAQI